MEHFKYRYNLFLKYTGFQYQEHQEDGMLWCIDHEINKQPFQNIHGGIIADEMGCGKTFMMISVIACHFVPHTLIVVPLALVNQWKQAIFNATGHEPLLYYGHKMKQTKDKLQNSPIVITTYGVISHIFDKNDVLFQMYWDRIIYDEAHHMRNKNTKKHIASLKLQSNIKWLVTGTPIQNSLSDLYSICNIIGISQPKKLQPSEIEQIVLKRTKEQVGISLPSIIVHENVVPWANQEEKIVANILHKFTNPDGIYEVCGHKSNMQSEGKDANRIDIDCIDDNDYDNNYDKNYDKNYDNIIAEDKYSEKLTETEMLLPQEKTNDISIKLESYIQNVLGKYYLSYYLRSRQMCTFPKLLSKLENNFHKSELYDSSIIEKAFHNNNKIMNVVSNIIKNRDNTNKKIVFCSFRKEMDVIHKLLTDTNIESFIYDGRITQKQRSNILKSQPNVLIIQIQMGCEGLNLQYANEIYFVGPLWNPATEDQAIARCYRLGQNKNTHVFKFIMQDVGSDQQNSMDNYMTEKMKNKKELQDFI